MDGNYQCRPHMMWSLNCEKSRKPRRSTLDPDVVGVLPIAVGGDPDGRIMQDEGKVCEGEITLGFSTTTEDASGEVVEQTLRKPL